MLDLSALGLRDLILIAAALVGAYLLLSLIPLLRTGRKPLQPEAEAPGQNEPDPPVAIGPSAPADSLGEGPRREPRFVPPDVLAVNSRDQASEPSSPGFALELAYSSLDLEVRRIRLDMDAIRAELERMAEEMRQLKATRNVAPIYSEALILAQQGGAPATIAAECGISIGEAELVAALARSGSRSGFDEMDDDRYAGGGR